MLDAHLAEVVVCERPTSGWIEAIRKALGMSMRELGGRIGLKQQSVARLAANEMHDSITLKSLRKVAEGMGCKLVYAIVPSHGHLKDIVHTQALKKAKEIVEPVYHSMMLEAQEVGNMQGKIKEIASDLAKNPNPKLWE